MDKREKKVRKPVLGENIAAQYEVKKKIIPPAIDTSELTTREKIYGFSHTPRYYTDSPFLKFGGIDTQGYKGIWGVVDTWQVYMGSLDCCRGCTRGSIHRNLHAYRIVGAFPDSDVLYVL